MIVTVTLNPAIDCAMGIDNYRENSVNRADFQNITAGGKGINISIILSRLGIETNALGFCGGETGKLLCNLLDVMKCPHDMTWLENQLTRINVKLKYNNSETEINGKGADISPCVLEDFICKLENILHEGDTLVLAGSIPSSVPSDIYAYIMKRFYGRNIRIVADSSGKPLLELLSFRPFLVKPNNFELGEILNREINTPDEAIIGAHELKKMGADNILVSLAEKGSVLLTNDNKEYQISAPQGIVKNSVGAGDSMLAGFLAGLERTNDYLYSLKLATACGSATAFSGELAQKHEIDELFNIINDCHKYDF